MPGIDPSEFHRAYLRVIKDRLEPMGLLRIGYRLPFSTFDMGPVLCMIILAALPLINVFTLFSQMLKRGDL